jgi:hypothetical protein
MDLRADKGLAMKKKKEPADQPPNCSVCDERPSDGSLYVSFNPHQRPEKRERKYSDPPRMDRGWSLHVPICGVCVRASVSVGVKLDLKNEKGTWGHVSPETPR